MSRVVAIILAAFTTTIAAAAPAHAQAFPDRPVKVVVAYPAGGPTDTVARLVTQNIAEQLGQGMIVENVAGAGGRIGTRDVARAAPDGYTLLLGGTNDNAITPVLYKSLDYDPAKDFVPVSAVATDSNASRLGRQRLQPAFDDAGDGVAVFLQHHHVAVAVDAAVGEVDEGVGDAGLGQVGGGAVIVGGVIGRLRRDDQDRDVFESSSAGAPARLATSSAPDRAYPACPGARRRVPRRP